MAKLLSAQARNIYAEHLHHRPDERGTRPTEWYRGDCPMAPRSRPARCCCCCAAAASHAGGSTSSWALSSSSWPKRKIGRTAPAAGGGGVAAGMPSLSR